MNFTFPILYPTIISIPPHPFNLNLDLQTENAENFVDTEQNLNKNEGRSKRGVLHLYNMVKCATGCNPLSYKGYGCFCGFLGSGHPIDPIDRYNKKLLFLINTNSAYYNNFFLLLINFTGKSLFTEN